MIGQYQESEEMKSSSLDSQLKKKEEELKLQEQEIVDQTQLHELTVKELQLSRDSLDISQQECSGLKTRVGHGVAGVACPSLLCTVNIIHVPYLTI